VPDGILEQIEAAKDNEASGNVRIRFRLYGESIRELGVLLLVFVPLETLLHGGSLALEWSAVGILVGLGLIMYGTNIQAEGEDK
jgi:hypothetical protein